MAQRSFPLLVLMTSLLSLTLVAPLMATSYVLIDDDNLADQSELIAWIEVVDVQVGRETGKITTDYDVLVDEVVKGSFTGSRLLIRVLGGVTPEGDGLMIWGAPRLRQRERALAFLGENQDGSFHFMHLMQGAFYPLTLDGEPVLVRGLSEARRLDRDGVPTKEADSVPARHAERFTAWLRDRAQGVERPSDYSLDLPAEAAKRIQTKFTLLTDEFVARWTEFDSGQSVRWSRHTDGQPGLSGGGQQEFNRARAGWNNEPNTAVRLVDAGTTTSTTGFGSSDGQNAILFTDLSNDIEEDFSCAEGGTLAVGGVSFVFTTQLTWKGRSARAIAEAEIVVNNGVSCFASGNPNGVTELYFHELGHTLGLGHSCGDDGQPPCSSNAALDDAAMRATIHDDGRGARLGSDDIAGLRWIYDPSFTDVPCSVPVGHPDYCRDCGPCGNGEGDCDRDSDCVSGLSCVDDIGASFGFGPSIDVCVSSGGGGGGGGCPVPVGHPDYCRDCGPCGNGQGDCDRDSDCVSGLVCGDNLGASFGFGPAIDVCVSGGGGGGGGGCPLPAGHPDFCRDCGPCGNGQGDCDRDSDCVSGASCVDNVGASFGFGPAIDVCVSGGGGGGGGCTLPAGHPDYCRDCGPCGNGQGDCDRDSDCVSGATCVDNVGASYGFGPGIDVCESSDGGGGGGGCTLAAGHPDFCRDCGPCSNGEGDCDTDSDCLVGLLCVQNIGADFGFGPGIDVCVQPLGKSGF